MNNTFDAQQYLRAATLLHYEKKHQKVILKCKRATTLCKSNTEAPFTCGNALYSQAKYKEAAFQFTRVIRLDHSSRAYLHLGNSHFLMGDYEEASRIYAKTIKRDPKHHLAYTNRGCALYSLKRPYEAIMEYIGAISITKRQNLAYFNLAVALFHLNSLNEGLKVFKQGITATQNSGQFSFESLMEAYTIQVTHIGEKLKDNDNSDDIEYLNRRLDAIKLILRLFKASMEGKNDLSIEISQIMSLKQHENESQYQISKVIEHDEACQYSAFLYRQLNAMFSQAILSEKSRIVGQDNGLVSTAISTPSFQALYSIFKRNLQEALLSDAFCNINKDFYKKFRDMNQMQECLELVSLKSATDRKLEESYDALELVGMDVKAREIFDMPVCETKNEKVAFADGVIIFFMCFLETEKINSGNIKDLIEKLVKKVKLMHNKVL